MTSIEENLAAAGVVIPRQAASPAGVYVPAVASGTLVITAGQLPFVEGTLPATAKVGAEVGPEDAARYARLATINALAAIQALLGSLERVTRIVKVVGFVASDADSMASLES